MYSSLSSIREYSEDFIEKNRSSNETEIENFTGSDLSGYCKLSKKINQIIYQMESSQFSKNTILPITFTDPSGYNICQ